MVTSVCANIWALRVRSVTIIWRYCIYLCSKILKILQLITGVIKLNLFQFILCRTLTKISYERFLTKKEPIEKKNVCHDQYAKKASHKTSKNSESDMPMAFCSLGALEGIQNPVIFLPLS